MMKQHKNNITKIAKISPIVIHDVKEDKKYKLRKGVYFIEYDDNTTSTIDIKNNIDITNAVDYELLLMKRSKMKVIFDLSKNDKKLGLVD